MHAMKSTNSQPPIALGIQLCLWITVFLWSSALVGIRFGLQGYSPGGLAVLRYLIASFSLLILYCKLLQRHVPNWRDLLYMIFIGVVGIGIYNIAINYGEVVIPAGIAGFIIGLMPVFTTIFAFFLLKERVPIKSWLGVFISFLGLLLIAY